MTASTLCSAVFLAFLQQENYGKHAPQYKSIPQVQHCGGVQLCKHYHRRFLALIPPHPELLFAMPPLLCQSNDLGAQSEVSACTPSPQLRGSCTNVTWAEEQMTRGNM